MAVNLRGVTTVLLPGTGSDDDYVYRAFSAALHEVGAVVVTPAPQPDRLIDGYRDALDNAARADADRGRRGVHRRRGGRRVGARPPRARRRRACRAAGMDGRTRHRTRRAGRAALRRCAAPRRPGRGTAQMRASSPPWLADELTRSWVGQWPSLPDAMDEAARFVAPTCAELERLAVPMGVAAATDDPIHPVEVGIEWVAAAPQAALRTVTLDEMGADPAVLGAACVAALLEAGG